VAPLSLMRQAEAPLSLMTPAALPPVSCPRWMSLLAALAQAWRSVPTAYASRVVVVPTLDRPAHPAVCAQPNDRSPPASVWGRQRLLRASGPFVCRQTEVASSAPHFATQAVSL